MLCIAYIAVMLLELTLASFFVPLWFFTRVYFSKSTACKCGVTLMGF